VSGRGRKEYIEKNASGGFMGRMGKCEKNLGRTLVAKQ
jgi:hypothetical protein